MMAEEAASSATVNNPLLRLRSNTCDFLHLDSPMHLVTLHLLSLCPFLMHKYLDSYNVAL